MLQSPHNDAVEDVLVEVQGGVLLQLLGVQQRAHERDVERRLVGQALDVLGRVGVDVLQRARELVVQALDEGGDAAGDAEDLARRDGRQLLVVLPVLGVLDHNNVLVVLENLQQLREVLLCPATPLATTSPEKCRSLATHSFHCSCDIWLPVPDVRSKRVEMSVSSTRMRW